MMDCSTCGYGVGCFCTIHHTVPGGCQDYISKQELASFDVKPNDLSVSFDVTAKITDQYIEFEKIAFDTAIEKWGYKRQDLERTLAELNQYRKIGTLEEVWEAVEKTKAAKTVTKVREEDTKIGNITFKAGTKTHFCPDCNKPVTGSCKYCPNCGKRLEREK